MMAKAPSTIDPEVTVGAALDIMRRSMCVICRSWMKRER